MEGTLVKIDMVAEKEITVTTNGRERVERIATNAIEPGGQLFYTLIISNEGRQPAKEVVVNNPVPDGATYVPGTAYGKGSSIAVSMDHGRSFTPEQAEFLAETITDLRWTINSLPGGSRRRLGFQVRAFDRETTGIARIWSGLYLWLLAALSR
jgi:uncharacterized repeat protein (TIGR01451 family)